jgi:hypothetical protein
MEGPQTTAQAHLGYRVVDKPSSGASVEVVINRSPQIEEMTASIGTVTAEVPIALMAKAVDPDGDSLSAHWDCTCDGSFSGSSTLEPVFLPSRPPEGESCTFSVEVSDDKGGKTHGQLVLTTKQPVLEIGPSIGPTVQSTEMASPGEVVDLYAQSSEADAAPLAWRWSTNVGTLLDQADVGTGSSIHWIAPDRRIDVCTVTVAASNAANVTAFYTFTIRM